MCASSLAVLIVASSSCFCEPPRQGLQAADELINLVPVFKGSEPNCRTLDFEVVHSFGDQLKLRYHATYQAPKQFRLVVSDTWDELPLLVMSDRLNVAYDAA